MKRLKIALLLFSFILLPQISYAEGGGDERDLILYFKEQDPYEKADQADIELDKMDLDLEERKLAKRKIYIDSLKRDAYGEQKRVISYLESDGVKDKVEFESHYIVNSIHLVCSDDILDELKKFPEIEKIEDNKSIENSSLYSDSTLELSSLKPYYSRNSEKSQGLEAVWNDYGIRGKGVTIGFIDSGVNYKHPALEENWRGYQASNSYNPDGNWLDLISSSDMPQAKSDHGTLVASAALGNDRERGNITGTAPDAEWIAVRAFEDRDSSTDRVIQAGEWMLAPGGDPSLSPDIINNSWGSTDQDSQIYDSIVNAWKAADIIPVFAAGNEANGANAGTIESPANLATTIGVGGVDSNNQLLWFSKRGPSSRTKEVKPDLVAPGSGLILATMDGYGLGELGTSISAPYVSGVCALVKEANPDLSNDQVKDVLIKTSDPLVDRLYTRTPNDGYGHGLVDPKGAVDEALERRVDRIYGKDRIKTSLEIAKETFEGPCESIYIVNSQSNTDILTASSLNRNDPGPILLTAGQVSSDLEEFIEDRSVKKAIIIGGDKAVSKSVEISLNDLGLNTERLSGKNRYDTAAQVAKESDADTCFLASGVNIADALSIAPISASKGYPILLTDGSDLTAMTEEVLKSSDIKEVIVLGGDKSISNRVYGSLSQKARRISGSDRFGTNSLINAEFNPSCENIILANGTSLVDALTVSPYAVKEDASIVLVKRDELPKTCKDYTDMMNIKPPVIVGGDRSVSTKVIADYFR